VNYQAGTGKAQKLPCPFNKVVHLWNFHLNSSTAIEA